MEFEGPEKKFELFLEKASPSLRERGTAYWSQIVEKAGARILSQVSNKHCDAYLLSESSLLVSDDRVVMITCGTTHLSEALCALLKDIPGDEIRSLIFERKDENFPGKQVSSFDQDVSRISDIIPGSCHRFGPEAGAHISLFHLNKPCNPDPKDFTLEILMHDVCIESQSAYSGEHQTSTEIQARRERLYSLLSGFVIDDHFFEPNGYSLNAIKGKSYVTIHVTPQEVGSFVSLETNCHSINTDEFISQLLEIFKPERTEILCFGGVPQIGKRQTSSQETLTLSCGYKVWHGELPNMELPMPIANPPKPAKVSSSTSECGPGNSGKLEMWIEEKHQDIVALKFRANQLLFSEKSKYQQVDIIETPGFGKMLLNDGLVMISERDEAIYHEMIAHVPLFSHPNPKNVLVIGGGDGGTVREVLRHPSVEKCSLVEIDELVVNACREHIPQTAACLSDPRVEVLITDGVEFVRKTKRKFDIIIVDSTDPIGAAAPLFGQEFYKNVTSALTLGGIVVSQAASPFYEKETQLSMLEIQQSLFKNVHMFNFSNLSYPGGLWSFSYASQTCCPIEGLDSKRVNDLALEFYYYNESVHKAAFCLPSFMSRGLEAHLSPLPKEGV